MVHSPVREVLHRHVERRKRDSNFFKCKIKKPIELLTARQFMSINKHELFVTMDVEMLQAVYECFLHKQAPKTRRPNLAMILTQIREELPAKMKQQEEFCTAVDKAMLELRLPLVRGLGMAVKVSNWFNLLGRPHNRMCRAKVSTEHMMLVDLGASYF